MNKYHILWLYICILCIYHSSGISSSISFCNSSGVLSGCNALTGATSTRWTSSKPSKFFCQKISVAGLSFPCAPNDSRKSDKDLQAFFMRVIVALFTALPSTLFILPCSRSLTLVLVNPRTVYNPIFPGRKPRLIQLLKYAEMVFSTSSGLFRSGSFV